MYVLDTDHISLLERDDSVQKQRLLNRLNRVAEGEVATTIIALRSRCEDGWPISLSRDRLVSKLRRIEG